MKKTLLHLFLLCFGLSSFAQTQDSTRTLPEAEVRGEGGKKQDIGKSIQILKATPLQFDLGSMLQGSSPVTIKSYGPGMLSSLSIRGTGAAHTAILWHGLNIQNGMNGQQDLSLIPGFLFDQTEIRTGTQNVPSTGGILGGRIDLNNANHDNRYAFNLGAGFGSFGTSRYYIGLDVSDKNWSNRTRVARQSLDNRYSYFDRSVPGNPEKTMEHASAEQTSVLNEFQYHFNQNSRAGLGIWYSEAKREIPPTLLSSSTANQYDQSMRMAGFYESISEHKMFRVSSGLFLDKLWYRDLQKKINAENESRRWTNQVSWESRGQKINWELGAGLQTDMAKSPDYLNKEVQLTTLSIYGGLHGTLGSRVRWHADLRQEMRDQQLPKPSASLGADYQLTHKSKLTLYVAHISRLPNLNDLYWNPGGNPDLKAESGFSGELGYRFLQETKSSRLKAKVQAYYSIINNWIIWLPEAGYWTPQNLQQVHNRGLEWEASVEKATRGLVGQFLYGGSFTLASNEKAKNSQDLSVGKQLIYVPFWKNYVLGQLQFKGIQLLYRHSFTGGRYTSTDNTSFLPAYSTGDIELNYQLKKKASVFVFGGSVQNLWDVRYESVEWRPMPGRYFQASIKMKLIYKRK